MSLLIDHRSKNGFVMSKFAALADGTAFLNKMVNSCTLNLFLLAIELLLLMDLEKVDAL